MIAPYWSIPDSCVRTMASSCPLHLELSRWSCPTSNSNSPAGFSFFLVCLFYHLPKACCNAFSQANYPFWKNINSIQPAAIWACLNWNEKVKTRHNQIPYRIPTKKMLDKGRICFKLCSWIRWRHRIILDLDNIRKKCWFLKVLVKWITFDKEGDITSCSQRIADHWSF